MEGIRLAEEGGPVGHGGGVGVKPVSEPGRGLVVYFPVVGEGALVGDAEGLEGEHGRGFLEDSAEGRADLAEEARAFDLGGLGGEEGAVVGAIAAME